MFLPVPLLNPQMPPDFMQTAFVIATIKVCYDPFHCPTFPSADIIGDVVFECIFILLFLSDIETIPAHPLPESGCTSWVQLPVFCRQFLVLAAISTDHFSSFLGSKVVICNPSIGLNWKLLYGWPIGQIVFGMVQLCWRASQTGVSSTPLTSQYGKGLALGLTSTQSAHST